MNEKFEMVKFTENGFELDVKFDTKNETVWLTQEEMGTLFNVDRTRITRHVNNIFSDNEITKDKSNVRKTHFANSDRPVNLYSLDVVLAVGYRVNSQRGIAFRRWANKIIKDYLIKGYAINEKRLSNLNKTINIQNRMLSASLGIETDELSSVINEYTKALDLLDDYDHRSVKELKGRETLYYLQYDECRKIIDSMKFGNSSSIFGVEKEEGKLEGILMAVYQHVFGQEVYPTLESKAVHLLYFLVKDHPFYDGCKRIAATLFLEFLNKNHALVRDGRLVLSNNALVAITLLIAESNPDEMDIIVNAVGHMLSE